MIGYPQGFPLFPTRRSSDLPSARSAMASATVSRSQCPLPIGTVLFVTSTVGLVSASAMARALASSAPRSEEHTSELQSPCNLVCRLLLEKKKHTRPPTRRRRDAFPPLCRPAAGPWLTLSRLGGTSPITQAHVAVVGSRRVCFYGASVMLH